MKQVILIHCMTVNVSSMPDCICYVEPTMPDPLTPSEVDAIEYFENHLRGDGLKFTWDHAVNSQSKLQSALNCM